ncbi:MAG: flagellar biosynthesis protein FlhA [Alphaproteobacteria bacterium]
MAEQQATTDPFADIKEALKRPDVAFAFGLISILVVLVMPLPSWLLDMSLAISLTFSVVVLMTVLFINKPLDFNSFPTVLLISTMLRLALNVASTRLILSNGHEGTHAAGKVIQAFGNFVMGGNFVIGLIVFFILVIVNFVVITKGSGRIAEVSARFSLDAMPGKQMAIDADLSAGIIDEETAKTRRKELEDESNFYGAMDGAAKFVRGDAIAGLCITAINVVGGIIIGMAQMNLSLGDAAHSYTILTVGDGLITQIPALIISTGAGMLVSKAGVEGSAEKAMFSQMSAHPHALGISSFLLGTMALLPGIPFIPFTLLSGLTGYGAWKLSQTAKEERKAQETVDQAELEHKTEEESPLAALAIDSIRLEMGYGLLSLLNSDKGKKLPEQIKSLRKQLAGEFGFVLPPVRIQDNMQLPNQTYCVRVKEIEAGRGEVRPDMLLVMDPTGQQIHLPGEETIEPTFGLKAKWIAQGEQEEAKRRGYTVVDPATVITTHLAETIKDNMVDLLSFSETKNMLDNMDDAHKKLLKDVVPNRISQSSVQGVLQNLLAERVSIRDLPTIMESIAEACNFTQDVDGIYEHVRARLSRQICAANMNDENILPIITLSPDWEQRFTEAIIVEGEARQLALPPTMMQDFIQKVRDVYEEQAIRGEMPVLLTNPQIRPYVRSVVERFRSLTVVMSQNEIHPKIKIKTCGQVN